MKKSSKFEKSFAVFEKKTGQAEGKYRYRYAGKWLDRTPLTPSESGLGEANKIIIEAWP